MGPPKRIDIDPHSGVAVRLTMMLDDLVLATGSGFLWKKGETLGVVTAWHCLTGTHPETRQSLNPGKAARPNKIAVSLLMSDMGEGTITIRSEEHTSELQSLMRISYAVFCLKKKNTQQEHTTTLMLNYTTTASQL